jgi:peptidyl-prolyl cis-trans isomerase SurA
MKKIFVFAILGLNFCFAGSKEKIKSDPAVMTVAGKEILMSEFLFLAQKDSSVDLKDKKSLENYVTLFKNFKLKVADAEAEGIHKSREFENELSGYKSQLRASYLSDKEGETEATREVYDRNSTLYSVSHIVFPLPGQTASKDTVAVYEKAMEIYRRIQGGEDFTAVGQALAAGENSKILYENIEYLYPLQTLKAFEDAVYALPEGTVSTPVRTAMGFHLIRVNRIISNPGKIQVAHIMIVPPPEDAGPADEMQKLFEEQTKEVYEKVKNGEDFAETAKNYSLDVSTNSNGGLIPPFGLGEMVKPFEVAAFALKEPGDISEPVLTRFGYHIIKLLSKPQMPAFEEMERDIHTAMKKGERNFDLYRRFDEREKAHFGYVFHPEAYEELQRIGDEYFPTDTAFYNRASRLTKTLMQLDTLHFPQKEFADYVKRNPFSTKTCSADFLSEVYRLFIRDIVTELEKRGLESRHPEIEQLVREYHDGILLFEISSRRVWDKPIEDQARLETEWLKELSEKYPVEINWKALKTVRQYLK